MGSFTSKPVKVNPITEKDKYIGLPLQLTAPSFATAGFTVQCIAVKPADMYHPPNGRVNNRRVTILYDWITQAVREIHVG